MFETKQYIKHDLGYCFRYYLELNTSVYLESSLGIFTECNGNSTYRKIPFRLRPV